MRIAFAAQPHVAHQRIYHARQSTKPRAAKFLLNIAAQQGADHGNYNQFSTAQTLFNRTAEIPPPQQVEQNMHQREVHKSVGEITPEFKFQRRVKRPCQPEHHRLVAQHVHRNKHQHTRGHHQPGYRTCAFAQCGQERITLVVQTAVGLTRLPACREVARIARILQKSRQFSMHALGLGLIRQPDIRLLMLLNRQDNALCRHIINKCLRHAGVSKRGNHQHGCCRLFHTKEDSIYTLLTSSCIFVGFPRSPRSRTVRTLPEIRCVAVAMQLELIWV